MPELYAKFRKISANDMDALKISAKQVPEYVHNPKGTISEICILT